MSCSGQGVRPDCCSWRQKFKVHLADISSRVSGCMCLLRGDADNSEEIPRQTTKCTNQHAKGCLQQELYVSWDDHRASASTPTSVSAETSDKRSMSHGSLVLDLELTPEQQEEGCQSTDTMQLQRGQHAANANMSVAKSEFSAPSGLRVSSAPAAMRFVSHQNTADGLLLPSSISCLDDCSACSPDIERSDASQETQTRWFENRQRASTLCHRNVSRAEAADMHSAPASSGWLALPISGKPPARSPASESHMAAGLLVPPAFHMLSATNGVAASCGGLHKPAHLGPRSSTDDSECNSMLDNTCSDPGKLLVMSPGMPDGMRRSNWSLSGFWICRRLYNGYASSVYHAIDRQTSHHVALKIYHTGRLEELNRYQVLREVFLHSQLQHENIVQMYAAFQDNDDVVMVLDYAGGGDLYGLLKRAGGRLPEEQALDLVLRPFLAAMEYLHGKGIVHRDIKPENMLLSSAGTLKIADFGLAIDLNREKAVTRAGTLDYMAPEVLRCPPKEHPYDNKTCKRLMYNQSVDVWAAGVLAYELLVGFPPFSGSCPSDAMSNIMAGAVVFPKRVTPGARQFVEAALQSHPGDRPTVAEMAANPWISRT